MAFLLLAGRRCGVLADPLSDLLGFLSKIEEGHGVRLNEGASDPASFAPGHWPGNE